MIESASLEDIDPLILFNVKALRLLRIGNSWRTRAECLRLNSRLLEVVQHFAKTNKPVAEYASVNSSLLV